MGEVPGAVVGAVVGMGLVCPGVVVELGIGDAVAPAPPSPLPMKPSPSCTRPSLTSGDTMGLTSGRMSVPLPGLSVPRSMPQAQRDRHKRNAKIKQRFFFIVRLLKHYGSSICMKRANISQKVFHFCMLLPHCQNGADMIRYWAWKN